MFAVKARNVNDAFVNGLWQMRYSAVEQESRNGRVLALEEPMLTTYTRPYERVLFNARRDANPFFHLMECVWMMAGSNSVRFIERYNARMGEFSDNQTTLHGAYGHRWRNAFEFDQLRLLIELLQKDPQTRRAVLQMWSTFDDLRVDSKDLPCNTHAYFRVQNGALEMTICCRSNDMIWGAYGANAVHFSFLQEFLARALDLQVGPMHQFSNNMHIYERHWDFLKNPPLEEDDPYSTNSVVHVPLMPSKSYTADLLRDCEAAMWDVRKVFTTPFFCVIVSPAMRAWEYYKSGDLGAAKDLILREVPHCDWGLAMHAWLERRVNREPQNGTNGKDPAHLR